MVRIVTYDRFRNLRKCGGDAVVLPIEGNASSSITDNLDGTYTASYTFLESAPYSLPVLINGSHVPGSPFGIQVAPNSAHSSNSIVKQGSAGQTVAGVLTRFDIESRDEWGNRLYQGGRAVSVVVDGLSDFDANVEDLGDGLYAAFFVVRAAGKYKVRII